MMKNSIKMVLSIVLLVALSGCGNHHKLGNIISFGISAEYPPFEYMEKGVLTGFDVELAELVGKELGKKVVFEHLPFNAIFASIQTGFIDAGISTITVTKERQNNFDFSECYYHESLTMLYPEKYPLMNASQMHGKKIACQLGTTMEVWLKEHALGAHVITFDTNPQAVEALKAGHVDGVLIDTVQGNTFTKKNAGLACCTIAQSDDGYAVCVKKDSPLKHEINQALKTLQARGKLNALKKKWFEGTLCNS